MDDVALHNHHIKTSSVEVSGEWSVFLVMLAASCKSCCVEGIIVLFGKVDSYVSGLCGSCARGTKVFDFTHTLSSISVWTINFVCGYQRNKEDSGISVEFLFQISTACEYTPIVLILET